MTLIPALIPPRHSKPVPAKFMKGYWSNFDVRVHCCANFELKVIEDMDREWLDRGGLPRTSYVVEGLGGMLSLIMPEADPRRMIEMSSLCSIAFYEDDLLDGDLCDINSNESDAKLLHQKYRNAINQMKSRVMVELLKSDDEQNTYVQAYEQWTKASAATVESTTIEFETLEEYLNARLDNSAASCAWNMLPILHDFKLTRQDKSDLECIDQLTYRMMILINDYYSIENDWISHETLKRPGVPFSAAYVIMRTQDVSVRDAKNIIQQEFRKMEISWTELRDKLMKSKEQDPATAHEYAKYITCLQNSVSGILLYTMHAPRYNPKPSISPLFPKPEQKIATLPRTTPIPIEVINRLESPAVEGSEVNHESESESSSSRNSRRSSATDLTSATSVHGEISKRDEFHSEAAWLSEYSPVPEEEVLEPFEYVKSMPSKKVRHALIDALDIWYQAPPDSVELIKKIIDTLHTSSLIIDDIEDNSDLRRGQPAAHMVFGTPQSINTANFLLITTIEDVQKLSSSAVSIYAEELKNLHIGQGSDLKWTFQGACPSELEYIQMIDGKTGGLFRMASRFMKDQATINKDLDVERLLTLMGRFFQIRDDYQNLGSLDYANAKGDLSDLDEGKYSFMLIHALNNNKNSKLRNLLALRSRQGSLSIEQKRLIMKGMAQSKSMEYTCKVLEGLEAEIQNALVDVESRVDESQKMNGYNKNWMLRAIMAKLRFAEVKVASLQK
ncbi:hypothetical protein TWF694_001443 [Orbilia ellipsospora]|uniref:Uncharacterized protein n=1 Tax=Orbilia ellipsospora TaxID=2528407 RepID=A0AAV9XRN6_9PEZI